MRLNGTPLGLNQTLLGLNQTLCYHGTGTEGTGITQTGLCQENLRYKKEKTEGRIKTANL